ncbi:MAG: UDP binding domain-containing protein [Chromatiales bacterium]
MDLRGKKLVVIGGAGLIGSHTVDLLGKEDAGEIVLLTEWNVYRGLDLERIKSLMKGRVFCDLRNVYEPATMAAAGFQYVCVGR